MTDRNRLRSRAKPRRRTNKAAIAAVIAMSIAAIAVTTAIMWKKTDPQASLAQERELDFLRTGGFNLSVTDPNNPDVRYRFKVYQSGVHELVAIRDADDKPVSRVTAGSGGNRLTDISAAFTAPSADPFIGRIMR